MKIYSITLFLCCINTAIAADGTINFTGNITDAACTVDSSSANQTVNLGTVSSQAFSSAGDSAAPTEFSINLTACPVSVATASVTFDGASDSSNDQLLQLTSGSTAAGVGIGIYEADSSTIVPMHVSSVSQPVATTATLNFIAKYVSTAASVTAGTANGVADFTVTYN